MTEHILKTLPPYWDAIAAGEENFEVRRDDRGFQKGDVLVLEKLNRFGTEAGIRLRRRITYILTGGQFGIEPGYVVIGLENYDGSEEKAHEAHGRVPSVDSGGTTRYFVSGALYDDLAPGDQTGADRAYR